LGVRTTTADMIGSCCGNRPALDKLDRTKLKGGLLEREKPAPSLKARPRHPVAVTRAATSDDPAQ